MVLVRGLPMEDVEQRVRRAFFNVLGRKQDDHVKNIAFLMDRSGTWRLSPAFDLAYSFNPTGAWTSQHQMTLNAKRDHFEVDDLIACAQAGGVKKSHAGQLLQQVSAAIEAWPSFAERAALSSSDQERIQRTLRCELFV